MDDVDGSDSHSPDIPSGPTPPSELGSYYRSMPSRPVARPDQGSEPDVPVRPSRVDWSKFEGHGTRTSKPGNLYAWTTFVMLAIYVVIASLTGFALIGIAPVLMAYRSWSEGEALAPVAVLGAIAGVVAAFVVWPIF
jgi:hypothetical protein